jgi:hypothetical protein
MNAIRKLMAGSVLASVAVFGSMNANAWWNDDDYYDRWDGGRWYGDPPYAWGGCPGYGWGYPSYGWGGYPCSGWGGYPGYGQTKTIIVNPQVSDSSSSSKPVIQLPK